MTSKLKTDVLETVSGSGTIALTNQLSGMTHESMPAGSVIQVVSNRINVGHNSTTSTTYTQVGGVGLAITPTSTSSKILVIMHAGMGISYRHAGLQTAIARGATLIDGTTYNNYHGSGGASNDINIYHNYTLMQTDSPNTTSLTTYNLYFASTVSGQIVYGTHTGSAVDITLMEIKG
jgi:hypothetical protein